MQKIPTKEEKIKHLYEEKARLTERLGELYKRFRGLHHEDSASEMKYTTIKVFEAHVQSINAELRSLGEIVDN